jgi:hypothetical protein
LELVQSPFRNNTWPTTINQPQLNYKNLAYNSGDIFMAVRTPICALALLVLLAQYSLQAADAKNPAFTSAVEAGPEYELQGEYVGDVKMENENRRVGIQVIALGDGKFRAMGFVGGLPGEGWSRGDEVRMGEGEMADNSINFTDGDIRAEVKAGVVTVFGQGNEIGKLAKVHRQSPTLGQKAPAGAVVLFDGVSADNFENGKLVEKNLLGATNCSSKQKFGDHSMHIEFRTPFMPKSSGQGRGNSGVYIQSRYELQVLDSFGLEGKNNECGGIYSISEPRVNMCFPPLAWQTYDIDFTQAKFDDAGKKTKNARVTIKHNGVVIHDDLELTHGTPGRLPEGATAEGLFLQDHGNPVAFRNIWVVEKK